MNHYFKGIPKVRYEGRKTDNPYAFKHYNPDEIVAGKPMKEHLRFAAAYWHTMCADGGDPFGAGSFIRPWDTIKDPMGKAEERVNVFFEFLEKMDIPFFCFHDRDVAPEGDTLEQTNQNLDKIVAVIKERMASGGKKLLWGTANLFSNPRFVHGASTSCSAEVYAYAAAQVKKAIEVTAELGGQNYVFWGGREGYETLLNTDMRFELENLARFIHLAGDYADSIGFKGQFLIEPKPKEPTKHQYDFDSATVIGFAHRFGLQDRLKLNIETNHATLAGHSIQHELRTAADAGMLGSVDANQGDPLLGWDTDQFPTDLYVTSMMMLEIIRAGGFTTGGLNFDAKLRRGSFSTEDLFLGHIAGMDSFARGLKIASAIIEEGKLDDFIRRRYSSFESGIGKEIVEGRSDFRSLEQYALANDCQIKLESGRQEYLETLINEYI